MYAQYNLGLMYDDGDGVEEDKIEAAKWYKKAADQKFPRAQYKLGELYRTGKGVSKDLAKALSLYKLASSGENRDAQFSLAYMYMSGTVVEKNLLLAHMWWNIAYSNGDEKSGPIRDALEREMTTADILKAKKMAIRCVDSEYENCS